MCTLLYLLYSLDMSRPGFAYDGYRWENGWPVERIGELETGETGEAADKTGAARETDNVDINTTEGNMDTAQVVSVQAYNPSIHLASESAGSTAGYSQVSEAEVNEDEDNSKPGQVNFGSAYAQCKAAREAANHRIVVDISCNENAMVSSTVGGDRVGSMDRGIDKSIENCFKGARIEKNGVLVNQYLSCSFDPATLVCITCETEHKLLEGGEGTECYCLTD
jgi:hypothetical protein